MVEEEKDMLLKKPYFMKDPAWYKYDEKNFRCVLTDKAPCEAIKSYEEFNKLLDRRFKHNYNDSECD